MWQARSGDRAPSPAREKHFDAASSIRRRRSRPTVSVAGYEGMILGIGAVCSEGCTHEPSGWATLIGYSKDWVSNAVRASRGARKGLAAPRRVGVA